jgi:cellulose synthase/poly-beta-1,6-N-acetylglucosamine synthase-like glycosyltransferase
MVIALMPPQLSLIIPAHNEEQRLPSSLEEIRRFSTAQGLAIEVLVVDNGSDDGTSDVVRQAARMFPAVRLIKTIVRAKVAPCVWASRLRVEGSSCLATPISRGQSANCFGSQRWYPRRLL